MLGINTATTDSDDDYGDSEVDCSDDQNSDNEQIEDPDEDNSDEDDELEEFEDAAENLSLVAQIEIASVGIN